MTRDVNPSAASVGGSGIVVFDITRPVPGVGGLNEPGLAAIPRRLVDQLPDNPSTSAYTPPETTPCPPVTMGMEAWLIAWVNRRRDES